MSAQTITEIEIAAAEALLGLSYSASERALMADNLHGQIASAQALRAFRLPNAAPMACRFDPRPPGFAMPSGPDRLRFTTAAPALPKDPEDIAFAPLAHLSDRKSVV